ncbi:MAG: NFACT family protein [Solobacterium sp.]|nr:NFACT family protein [Solobacterium sp.]
MAIDGILMHKTIPLIQQVLPLRIQKIYEISNTEILFQTHGRAGKKQLLISCHSVYNRILFTERSYPTPQEPGNFVMLLRKYLEGSFIENIEQAGLDRWCKAVIRHVNMIGDIEYLYLYTELMGKYANVILVSQEGKIIDALKRIPPFENSRRTILPGAVFTETGPQDKKDPFVTSAIDPERSLTAQFSGFSPFLAKEAEYRMAHGETFADIMNEIEKSDSLYIANSKNEAVYHCIELKHIGECRRYPVMEGFDILYYHKEEKDRIKQISGDVFRFAARQLKHNRTKLPRLLEEYDESLDCDRYRKYGDLLFTYSYVNTKGRNSVTVTDYETDEPVDIPVDPKLSTADNARKAYQKYNKRKKGQTYLQEQIRLCENEISYFEGILEQLDQADFTSAAEIRDELIQQGYLSEKSFAKKSRRKKKDTHPAVFNFTVNGISVSFGRNNLQNDWLTWHAAAKSDIWMHAKDYHGSHLVIHSTDPDEDTVRKCAAVAAYYSAGRMSSSVPVVWCPVRNLKKIPGAKPGMVQLGSYRTIYIDPDPLLIEELGIAPS